MCNKDLNNQRLEQPGESGEKEPRLLPGAGRWLGLGVEFGGVIGIFTWAGYWADRKLGSSPWLMVTGLMVGFVGMTYLLYKETRDFR